MKIIYSFYINEIASGTYPGGCDAIAFNMYVIDWRESFFEWSALEVLL